MNAEAGWLIVCIIGVVLLILALCSEPKRPAG